MGKTLATATETCSNLNRLWLSVLPHVVGDNGIGAWDGVPLSELQQGDQSQSIHHQRRLAADCEGLERQVAQGDLMATNWRTVRIFISPTFHGVRHVACCPCCGTEFGPAPQIVSAIESLSSDLAPTQSPCLDLADAAFADPRLLSSCPHCAQALKFNPFFVDMRQ